MVRCANEGCDRPLGKKRRPGHDICMWCRANGGRRWWLTEDERVDMRDHG